MEDDSKLYYGSSFERNIDEKRIQDAYERGRAEGLRLAIRLLKTLRPEMGGLGGPIFILQEILDGKSEIPEEVSAGE